MIDPQHGWNISYKPLFLGFICSLILTFSAYMIVVKGHLSNDLLILTMFGIVVLQTLLQLVFYFHLGLESKPHWNSISFVFVLLIVCIIVGGSLWIMSNLNYNLMPPMDSMR